MVKRTWKLLPLLLAAMVLTGCSSSYLVDRPLVLPPCQAVPEAQQLSTAALIRALESKRWSIEGVDLEAGLVRAKSCRNSYCLFIDGEVGPNGEIQIQRTPRQYVSRKGGKLLKRWMHFLQQAYQQNRCLPPATLQQTLQRPFPPFEPIPVSEEVEG